MTKDPVAEEENWSLPPYKMTVIWTKSDPNAYKFIFDPFGRFNHVDADQKKIYLTESITDGTLVHEIGHVLGFADHYVAYWDEKDCQITGSAFLRDVMANSYFKKPLLGHWLIIDKAYPLGVSINNRRMAYLRSDVFFKEQTTKTEAKAGKPLDSAIRLQHPLASSIIPQKP